MTLADLVPTGTFLAVSPFITATLIGGLFAFTVAYSKRAQIEAAAMFRSLQETAADDAREGVSPAPAPEHDGSPQIPLP
jgi:hypothetical protein